MKRLFLAVLTVLFFANVCVACDATIYPRKNYLVVAPYQINSLKFENEVILSGQLMASIFAEKNQLILKPKNIGKTKMFINDKTFLIEVSQEQKQEWNIKDFTCVEIDNPFDEKEDKEGGSQ